MIEKHRNHNLNQPKNETKLNHQKHQTQPSKTSNSTIKNIKLTHQKHQHHPSKTSGRGQLDDQEAYGIRGVFERIGHD